MSDAVRLQPPPAFLALSYLGDFVEPLLVNVVPGLRLPGALVPGTRAVAYPCPAVQIPLLVLRRI